MVGHACRDSRNDRKVNPLSISIVTISDIVDLVLDLLAEQQKRPVDELRADMEAAGREMPIDSMLIVEILTRVEERYGVRIAADAEAARSTRSVLTFAKTIHDAINERFER